MTHQTQTQNKPMQAIRRLALSYPEVEEGTSCRRTSFKARNKAFLFMGSTDESYDVMLKLKDSLPEAKKLAAKQSAHYKAGAGGWVTARFTLTPPPQLERWIDENYRLLAHKQLVAMLPARNSGTSGKSKKVVR